MQITRLVRLLAVLIALLLGATRCRKDAERGEGEEEGPATAVVHLEPVHPELVLAAAVTVKLGPGEEHVAKGVGSLRFPGLRAGDYGVRVEGRLLAAKASLHVDERGAGSVTVKVVPLAPAPALPGALEPAALPETPEKRMLVDLTDPERFRIEWRQGDTVLVLTESPANVAALRELVAMQFKEQGQHQEASDAHRDEAVLVVSDGTPIERVGEAAAAVAAVKRTALGRAEVSAFRLSALLRSEVERPPPPPHAYESTAAPPAGKKPQVRRGAMITSGRLAPEAIEKVLDTFTPTIERCYWGGLARYPSLEGRVAVRFVIGRDGRVSNAAAGGDLPDGEVTRCMAGLALRLRFPEPEGGIVTVAQPYVFTVR
jgi:hypothetical protein